MEKAKYFDIKKFYNNKPVIYTKVYYDKLELRVYIRYNLLFKKIVIDLKPHIKELIKEDKKNENKNINNNRCRVQKAIR